MSSAWKEQFLTAQQYWHEGNRDWAVHTARLLPEFLKARLRLRLGARYVEEEEKHAAEVAARQATNQGTNQ